MGQKLRANNIAKNILFFGIVFFVFTGLLYSNIGSHVNWLIPANVEVAKAAAGVQTKVGSFSIGSTSGATLNITGLGFQPKYAYFWSPDILTVDGSAAATTNLSFGVAKSATERYAFAGRHVDAASSSDDGGGIWSVAWFLKGSSNSTRLAILDQFTPTADGFTVVITISDSVVNNTIVNYMAFGGDDITDVHVGTFATGTSSGVVDYTPLSFEPDYMMTFTSGAFNHNTMGSQNMRYSIAHMINGGSEPDTSVYSSWSAQDGVSTMNTASRQGTGKALLMLTPNNGTPLWAADFNGFLPNGFSLNYTNVSTTRDIPFIAVKGIRVNAHFESQKTSTGTQIKTGLGFQPKGLMIQSDGAAADDLQTDHIVWSLGFADGTSQGVGAWTHKDGTADSEISQRLDRTKAVSFLTPGTATVVADAEVASLDASGYTLNWTTADATPREMVVIAFGDKTPQSVVDVSGSAYADAGSTLMTGSKTVRLKVDGGGEHTSTLSSGSYAFTDIPVYAGGQVVTVYLDGETEKAVSVTVTADTESDITGLDLYQDHTIIYHESSGTVTAALLGYYDAGDDEDIFHSDLGYLNIAPGSTLLIDSGVTFNPGVNIVAEAVRVEGSLATDQQMFLNSLTGNGTVTSTGTLVQISGTGTFGTSGTWTINNLLFGDGTSGVTTSVSDGTVVINDSLTVGYEHIFDAGGLTFEIRGEVEEELSWWSDEWRQRRKITLNNTASTEDLIDFPILVAFDSTNIDYIAIQDQGQDLRFVDSDDETELAYEIETWNEAGTSYVWVKVPQIDAGSNTDHIYVYYNNLAATDAQTPAQVWDSGYKVVFHMNQDPSGSAPQILDSTSAGSHGSVGGAMTSGQQVATQVGTGLSFDGVNDVVNLSQPAILDEVFVGGSTFSGWIYLSGWGESSYGRLFDKSQGSTTIGPLFYVNNSNSPLQSLRFAHYFATGQGVWDTPASSMNTGNWHHVALTYDSAQPTTAPSIYIDGVGQAVNQNLAPAGALISDSDTSMTFGNNQALDRTFHGLLDEFRFSLTPRSAEWVEAEFNWTSNPKAYSVVGELALRPVILPFTVYGDFEPNESTIEYTTFDSHVITPTTYYNLVLNRADGMFVAEENFTVNNDLTISAGTLDLSVHDSEITVRNLIIDDTLVASTESDLVITGDFTNAGTFTHNDGTVVFAGSNESVITSEGESSNIFYNFSTSNAGGKTIKFEAEKPTKFEGTLTLSGTHEGSLTIGSTSTEQWQLWVTGSIALDRLVIINSGCYEGTVSAGANVSVLDGGNNDSDCWVFVIRGGAVITLPTGGGAGGSGAVGGGDEDGGSGGTGDGSSGEGAEGGGGSSGGGSASP